MPRISRQASNGPRMAPCALRIAAMRAPEGVRRARPARAPAMTSEWPFRYLVAECMTMSAPSASGRVRTGVAAVESTASRAPAAWAISADAGDVGDRPERVRGRLDPDELRRARLDRGAQRAEIGRVGEVDREAPARRVRGSQLRSAQYITFGATTWSPGSSARKTAVAAAMPEANSSAPACAPPPASRSPPRPRARWRCRAAVDVAGGIAVVGVAKIGRRHMDRRHDRPRDRIDMRPSAWAARLRFDQGRAIVHGMAPHGAIAGNEGPSGTPRRPISWAARGRRWRAGRRGRTASSGRRRRCGRSPRRALRAGRQRRSSAGSRSADGRASSLRQRDAVHHRHADVGDEQVEGAAAFVEAVEAVAAVEGER